MNNNDVSHNIKIPTPKTSKHYEKKRCFTIGLLTQFLSCKEHLQLTIFISYEC
jgi:hypothetical protein